MLCYIRREIVKLKKKQVLFKKYYQPFRCWIPVTIVPTKLCGSICSTSYILCKSLLYLFYYGSQVLFSFQSFYRCIVPFYREMLCSRNIIKKCSLCHQRYLLTFNYPLWTVLVTCSCSCSTKMQKILTINNYQSHNAH